MLSAFADALDVKITEIDPNTPLKNYGLESMVVVNITAELSDWLGVRVSPTLVYDFPTVTLLAKHLGELVGGSRSMVWYHSKTLLPCAGS